MKATEMMEILTQEAKLFRKNAVASIAANGHMISVNPPTVTQEQVDAVLVCFLNGMAARRWWSDLGLCVSDLTKP